MQPELLAFLQRAERCLERLEPLLPAPLSVPDWSACLAARWQREGRQGGLRSLRVRLETRLDDLLGVERQLQQLQANTRQFVAGWPANHALLWGARGTGKSSMVRALLREYAEDGLRLVEIERDHLADLPQVLGLLADQPQRFILFCDDLSFDAGEADYRVLKSVFDGSLEQAPDNVLIYATSNRRHLLAESTVTTSTGGWSMASYIPTRRSRTRLPCPIVLACGCPFIPSARSTTWRWYSTGCSSRRQNMPWS